MSIVSEEKLLEENINENCWSNRCYQMNIVHKFVDMKNRVAAYIVDVNYDTEWAGIERSRKVVIFRPRTVGDKLLPAQHTWSFLAVNGYIHEENWSDCFSKIEALAVRDNDLIEVTVSSRAKKVTLAWRIPAKTTEKEYRWERMIHFIINMDQVRTVFEKENQEYFSLKDHKEKLKLLAEILAKHDEFRLNAVQILCGLGFTSEAEELAKKLPYAIKIEDWEKYGTRGGKYNDDLIIKIMSVLIDNKMFP